MIRLSWRLARPNILSSAALLAIVALYAILTRNAMNGYLTQQGFLTCGDTVGACQQISLAFDQKFNTIINSYAWINLVPLMAGVFWGAPLIARELEEGTHRLAWTQTVSRTRWLATKLAIFLGGALFIAIALTVLMTWWFQPIEHIREFGTATFGRLNPDVFDFRGIVPVAYTLFAFAVGSAAGTFFKRSLAAIVATVVTYIPVKIVVQNLRENFMAPLQQFYPFGQTSPRATLGDWIIHHGVRDPSGSIVDRIGVPEACRSAIDQASLDSCVASAGYQFVDTYQPIGRFWTFQFIESGIFVGLSVILLGLTAWWIIRRIA